MNRTETQALPSVIHGIPLDEEQGLGALTLPGYLREVTTRYAQREALVMHEATGTTRWSYAELWAQSMAVARALNACGIGKDERVGVMLTHRPERSEEHTSELQSLLRISYAVFCLKK